jgi:hypothetical protein
MEEFAKWADEFLEKAFDEYFGAIILVILGLLALLIAVPLLAYFIGTLLQA